MAFWHHICVWFITLNYYPCDTNVHVSELCPKHLVLDYKTPKGKMKLHSMNDTRILGLNMILNLTTYSFQVFLKREVQIQN